MRILYVLSTLISCFSFLNLGFSQNLNLGSDVVICSANGTATITANATGSGTNNISSYEWFINSNPVGTSTSSLNVSANTTTNPQIVSCIVTLNNNNVLYDTVQVFTAIPTITTNPNNECIANNGSATMTVALSPALPTGYTASYSWSGPNGFSATGASATVNNFGSDNAGSYTATVTITSGGNTVCSSTISTQLNLIPAAPTFTLPATGCQSSSYSPGNFTPQPGFTYAWSTTPSSNSTGMSTANPTFNFTSGGTNSVTVTATSPQGCSVTSSAVNIIMPNFSLDAPSIEIGGTYFGTTADNPNTIAICLGVNTSAINIENVNVPPYGNNPASVTYTYSLNGSAPAPFNSVVSGTVVYGNNPLILTATYQGCTQTLNANVYLGSNPFVSLGTSNSIGLCPGTSLSFSINPIPPSGQVNPPGTTYTVFYSDTPGSTNTFTDLAGTTSVNHVYNTTSCGMSYSGGFYPANTFYAQVTAVNFCGQTASTVSPITVNNSPVANFTVSDSTICVGQSVLVTNTGNSGSIIGNSPPYTCSGQGKFYWTISGGVEGVDYNLTSGTLGFMNGNYSNTVGNGSNTMTFDFMTSGYYTITQHYYNSCGSKSKVRNICVIEPPTSQFSLVTDGTCSPVSVNLTNNSVSTTCNGSTVPMGYTWSVSTPGGATANYTTSSAQTPPTLVLTNVTSSPQTYTITLIADPKEPANPALNFANPNCSSTSSQTVLVNPQPVVNLNNIATCNDPFQVNVNLQSFTNTPNSTYTWSAESNSNVTGESTTAQNTSTINDNLSNSTSSNQTVNYSITATSSLGCVGNPTPFAVTMNVIDPGVISSTQTICNGATPSTLIGTSPSGPGSPSYQWQQSSNNITWSNISFATGSSYNPGAMFSTTYYRRVVSFVQNNVTCSDISNVIVINVNNVNAGTIGNLQNICTTDDPLPLTITNAASGAGTLSYQWQSGPSASGTFANITGQTGTSYDPPLLPSTTHFRLQVTSILNGVSCTAFTPSVPINVYSLIPGVIASSQTICVGGDPALLTSTANATSTGTSITYQWQQSTNNTDWNNIIGATNSTFDPPVLTTTMYYRRVALGSLAGVVICEAPANTITITVVPDPTVTAPVSQTICAGSTPTPLQVVASGGSSSAYAYQWFNSSGSLDNQTSSSFSPPDINETYYCVVSVLPATTTGCQVTSASATVSVIAAPIISVPQSDTYCFGDANINPLSITVSGTTSNDIDYQWYSNTVNSTVGGTPIPSSAGGTSSSFTPSIASVGPMYYYCTVSIDGSTVTNCPSTSEIATITVLPAPSVDAISNFSICHDQTSQFFNFSGIATGYNWVSSNPATGIPNSANNVLTFDSFNATNTSLLPISSQVTVTPIYSGNGVTCQSTSTTFTVTVNPVPVIDAVPNQTVCHDVSTEAITFSGSLPNTTYTWSSSNATIGLNPTNGTNFLPAFVGQNTTNNIQTAVITVTPSTPACTGIPLNFNININPRPTMTNTVMQQTICAGVTTPVVWSNNLLPSLGVSYTWSVIDVGSNLSGYIQNGTGDIPAMTIANSGVTTQIVVYTLSPSFANCIGQPINYTFIVNPGPIMSPIPAQEICSGSNFSTSTFSSPNQDISYNWQLTTTNIPTTVTGYPLTDNVNIIAGSNVVNTSSMAVTLIYEVTPSAYGCTGIPQLFSLTVHPELQVFFSEPNQTICDGAATTPISLTSNASNTVIHWSVDAVPPGLTGLDILSGTDVIPAFNFVNTTSQGIQITFTVQAFNEIDSTLCPGELYSYNLTIIPGPSVNPVPNQLVCHGANTSEIIFNGTGTSYTWVSDLPGIGIAANGVNSIPSFVAQNTQSTTLVANITVSPLFLLNGINCFGAPITFTISVNPSGQMNPIQDVVVCNDAPVESIPFTSNNYGGTNTYSWNNPNSSTGLTAGGLTAFTPAFIGQNSGILPNVSQISVTPTFTYLDLSCPGTVQNFNITINPTPVIFSTSDTLICNNTPLFLAPNTNVPSIFEWQGMANPDVIGITTNIQNGSGIDQTLNNTSNTQQVVSYSITPISSPQGCYGQPSTINVTVQPNVSISSQTNFDICSGTLFNAVLTSNVPATFQWFASTNPNVSGASTLGNTGNVINDILTNISNTSQQVVYTAIPTILNGNCSGDPLVINVLVNPELVITTPNTHAICSGDQTNIQLTANAPGTFSWFAVNNPNVAGLSLVIQNTNVINNQLVNATNTVQQVEYNVVVTATNQGCTSQNYPITVTVNPEPTISSLPQTVVCANQNITPIIPNGVYTSFNWVNNNVQSGLGASGNNATQLPSFLAQNPNNFSITPQIFMTPFYVGSGLTCQGQASTGQITINPIGQINTLSTIEVCNNQNVAGVVFSTQNVQGTTTYAWTNNNINVGLGLTSGVGGVPGFTSTNTTNQPISSTISTIATFTNHGVSCPSQPQSYNIIVNPVAQVNSLADLNYCVGNVSPVIPFTGLAANAFSWTNTNAAIGLAAAGNGSLPSFTATNATNNSIQGTVTVTGNYNSLISSLSCPGNAEDFTITVSPTVFVNPSPNQSLCAGETTQAVNFTSNVTNANIIWTNSNTAAGLAQTSGTSTLPAFVGANNSTNQISTTISVSGSINSCTGPTQNFNISVNPIPQIINSATQQNICSGQQTQVVNWQQNLAANNIVSYTWNLQSANPNITGAVQNGVGNLPAMTLINADVATQSIVYIVTPASNGCVGLPFVYSVFVSPSPEIDPVPSSIICTGEFYPGTVFTSNVPGVNFQWNLSGIANIPATVSGYPTPSGVGAIPGAVITNTGSDNVTLNYSVTSNIGSCTGTTQTMAITVVPNPVLNLGLGNQEICSNTNSNAVLITSPTTGTVITWQSNNPSGLLGLDQISGTDLIPEFTLTNQLVQNQIVNFTVSGVVPGVGCVNQQVYTITVLPIPSTFASNAEVCSENFVNIPLTSDQNASFVWSAIGNPNVAGATINDQNTPNINNQLFNITSTTQIQQYTVQSFLVPQGCPGETIVVDVLVNNLPYAAFESSSPCESDTIFFTNLSNQSNLFVWNFGDGSNSFLFEPWNIYSQNGNYTVSLQVTDAVTGCIKTVQNPVMIPGKPTFDVDTTQHCVYGQFTFNNLTPGTFTDVVWDFGDGDISNEVYFPTHVYTGVGCYDITLSLVSGGCPYSLTIEDMVCILPNPVANFVVPESIQSYNNNLFTFENLSQHAIYYLWDFGDGTTSNSIHPNHSYNSPAGIYSVTLVALNEYGCADTTKFSIQLSEGLLVYVPNSFTPNGDLSNGIFKPIITEGIDIYTYRLLIFNRWGEVLFESLNKEVGWDGTYGGKIMQDGVYVWRLTFNSINNEEEYEFFGHVNLIR